MTMLDNVRIEDDWLKSDSLQALFDILCADGGEARVAGGAVRNALMGQSVNDVDVCTTVLPNEVVQRLETAGHKAVPTGIDHGTVTAVINGDAYEVTTLREDVETNGRHAVVQFGTDWQKDAERRDLTINGLYCDRDGNIYDYVNGYPDIGKKEVRFIGDAETRIKEDSLRILRFFRFFAWYGHGRPDAAGLKACASGKMLLAGLSVERVWMEMKKLLSAPDPGRAILWMRTTGILGGILPETHKWGTDAIPGLLRLEQEQGWMPDPLFRLMGMVRPDVETMEAMAKRMTFSNLETKRMTDWAASPLPTAEIEEDELAKLLYRNAHQGILDKMRLEVVHLINRDDEPAAQQMLGAADFAKTWERPLFPVKGQDLLDAGAEAGPALGETLKQLEESWVESGFSKTKDDLLGEV